MKNPRAYRRSARLNARFSSKSHNFKSSAFRDDVASSRHFLSPSSIPFPSIRGKTLFPFAFVVPMFVREAV